MASAQVGDIGTALVIDLSEDISGAASTKIVARKPDHTTVIWSSTAVSETVVYVIEDGDLDQHGDWLLQAYVDLTTWEGYSTTAILVVGERLADATAE